MPHLRPIDRRPARTTRRLLLAGSLSLALACGAFALPAAASSVAATGNNSTSGRCAPGERTLTVDGAAVPIYIPSKTTQGKSKRPLVFLLHGSGSAGSTELKNRDVNGRGIEDIAESNGFIVAAPNGAVPFNPAPGISGYAWNIPGVPLVGTAIYPPAGTRDDVAFISHVIDAVGRLGCLDEKRVYSTGTSGGGRMSSQLACDLSNRIAAIAPISGVRYPLASDTPGKTITCATRKAVPVLAIDGVNDPINVFSATPPADQSALPAKIAAPVPGSS